MDFLSRVLPRAGEAPLSEVRMVQSRGARGLQLAGAQSAPSFPASQIFNNCDSFPGEFSIVVTFKIPRLANKVRERGKEREKERVEERHCLFSGRPDSPLLF